MALHIKDLAGDKRLFWIAEEWQRYSGDLAEWAMERLVNRRDVWSQYTVKAGEISVVMLPIKERRKAGTDMVTLKKLTRHFAGREPGHLIGLHSISDHQTCKWFAVDVDLHDEMAANTDELKLANFAACLEWANRLRAREMDPLLLDSNGVGGYHVWTLLDKEYPLADVYDFANELRSDYQNFGLPKKPEIFPPKAAVGPDDLPYGLRVPGRHHTRPHYTRVWNFDAQGENEWLEGGEAIEAMLSAVPAALPVAKKPAKPKVAAAKRRVVKKAKPRVCVDLDGVLARYDGWKGADRIGEPIPGALEFAKSLAKVADIVIFTSRCSEDKGGDAKTTLSSGQLRIRVIEWLEKHKFPFVDVYAGMGKPLAAAFIDDRSVSCRPQTESDAFEKALGAARSLVSRARKKLNGDLS
ncbi:MAG: hypothetical protein WBD22_12445 [Pyrinomonadaceae bacterium]